MNLQVTSPYKPCPFKCPYCVSNFEGEYPWRNFYADNRIQYLANLGDVLATGGFDGIVITGMTDPTLFPEWIEDVKAVANLYPLKEITLQTSDLTYTKTNGLTTLAYSVGKWSRQFASYGTQLRHSKLDITVRYNLMLSKTFDVEDIKKFIEIHEGAQYTIKYLMPTSNGDPETDKWIMENHLELTDDEWLYFHNQGVWIDKSCMDNETRYRIFREDGLLYDNWYQKPSEGRKMPEISYD